MKLLKRACIGLGPLGDSLAHERGRLRRRCAQAGYGRYRVDADIHRARSDDDHSRPRPVLWRVGAQEERARDRDAELRHHRPRDDHLDGSRLQPRLQGRRRLCRRPERGLPERRRCRHPFRHDSGKRLRDVPDDLRDHHPRADFRRGGRPHEVLGGALSMSPAGRSCATPRSAHWVWGGGFLEHCRRSRLRGRHGRSHQLRCGRPRGLHHARQASRLQDREHGPAQPACCRSSAPRCCGSAGSGSTPVRRLPPTASRAWPCWSRRSPPAAAALAWMFVEWIVHKKPSVLGAISGAVAGLVAITPASGFVDPMGALWIGIAAGIICAWAAIWLKVKLGYDDSLDTFGVHGVGGFVGAMLTGVFAVQRDRRSLRRDRRQCRPDLDAVLWLHLHDPVDRHRHLRPAQDHRHGDRHSGYGRRRSAKAWTPRFTERVWRNEILSEPPLDGGAVPRGNDAFCPPERKPRPGITPGPQSFGGKLRRATTGPDNTGP